MRLGLFFAALAWAGANHVSAQTIQLPSFSSFSVDTTVVVPDSGRAPAAGTRRASSGTSTFGGFPRQRASGSNWQAARIHVLAKIHDPAEADRALLDQALAGRAPSPDPAVTLKPDVTPAATEPGLASVAQIERQRIAQSVARQREAFTLYEKGRQAQAAGKPGHRHPEARDRRRSALAQIARRLRQVARHNPHGQIADSKKPPRPQQRFFVAAARILNIPLRRIEPASKILHGPRIQAWSLGRAAFQQDPDEERLFVPVI